MAGMASLSFQLEITSESSELNPEDNMMNLVLSLVSKVCVIVVGIFFLHVQYSLIRQVINTFAMKNKPCRVFCKLLGSHWPFYYKYGTVLYQKQPFLKKVSNVVLQAQQ
jgi:hypothetical protein